MKRVISFIIILVLLISMSVPLLSVNAADYGIDFEMMCDAVYVENLDTGIVMYEENADKKVPPASLTKMMTYIVVAESVPDLVNTKVEITSEALAGLDPASSVMGLADYIGYEFSVLDLFHGLMIPSGNDAALVLAQYVGDGSVDKFVDLMNRKAGQLKCSDTHFVNPHGLYDPNHYSTAYDLATIAKYAQQKAYFNEIVSKPYYQVEGMAHTLKNTNYMLNSSYPEYYYEPVTGIKTGYTDEAGKCLASCAYTDGYYYLCIALGAPYSYAEDVNYAMLDTRSIYQYLFNNVSFVELLSDASVVDSLSVEFVWGDKAVDVITNGSVSALLPNDYDESLVKTVYDLPDYVSAPIEKGQVIGSVTVFYDKEIVGTTDVVCAETFERDQTNYLMHRFIGFVYNNIIWLSIVASVVIVLGIMYINAQIRHKKRNSRYRYR